MSIRLTLNVIVFAALRAAAAPALLRGVALGGGNVGTNGDASPATLAMLDVLVAIGAGACRTNLYPGAYLARGTDWDAPTPASLDGFMSAAAARGVAPALLFEYYDSYLNTTGFGSYAQWRGIGAAFAAYLMPGGVWATAHGAPAGFGVTTFSAINEPDGGAGFTTGAPGPVAYALALAGLAAGVQAACPACATGPGGFMSVNAHGDATLAGLGPHLAPLWNDGTLAFMDLHTYFDVQYAPMNGTHRASAQANYDAVRTANGVTADVAFHATEYNFKRRLVTEDAAAAGLLTAMWDALGVVTTAGAPAATLAFPWNLFNSNASDVDYGMAASVDPYVPTARGATVGLVLRLLAASGAPGGWAWAALDPRGTGVFALTPAPPAGACRRLVVWQDRAGWSTLQPTTAFNVTGVPPCAAVVDVYGWDGLRRSVPAGGGGAAVEVDGLAGDETYMFLAHE